MASGMDLHAGDRVEVDFSGRRYVAVVSRTGVQPDIDPSRIKPAIRKAEELERVSVHELQFWDFVASYYMCTKGEVYKAAYPSARTEAEFRKVRKRARTQQEPVGRNQMGECHKDAVRRILALQDEGYSTVLLKGASRIPVYLELARRTLEQGRNVLVVQAQDSAGSQLQQRFVKVLGDETVLCYSAARTAAGKRDIAGALRNPQIPPLVVIGARSALFLPLRDLGLVIVDEEQASAHKQDTTAPRIHSRDAALALASIHGAHAVLGSALPSLESVYNAVSGKYGFVEMPHAAEEDLPVPMVVDTAAEKRKHGMRGSFSLKMIERMRAAGDSRTLVLVPWADTRDVEIEAVEILKGLKYKVMSLSAAWNVQIAQYPLVVLLRADYLSSRADFRCDERISRTLEALRSRCAGLELLIQTNSPEQLCARSEEDLLSERRQFGYPPYTRIVDIHIDDSNEARRGLMSRELYGFLCSRTSLRCMQLPGMLRFVLAKDGNLSASKQAIRAALLQFEAEKKYTSHIYADVDPL